MSKRKILPESLRALDQSKIRIKVCGPQGEGPPWYGYKPNDAEKQILGNAKYGSICKATGVGLMSIVCLPFFAAGRDLKVWIRDKVKPRFFVGDLIIPMEDGAEKAGQEYDPTSRIIYPLNLPPDLALPNPPGKSDYQDEMGDLCHGNLAYAWIFTLAACIPVWVYDKEVEDYRKRIIEIRREVIQRGGMILPPYIS